MPKRLRRCECGEYTLATDTCPHCGSHNLRSPHPPKFSPEDKFAKYRRMAKYGTKNPPSE
ncbi:MAG TPA: RNA-protein complex protein Nop10 [Candidatus Lokiarchaeia archaeon]|nr:RNA-protein complex protein Nop10 [Candidatus Lokiarchaeia archaeon]